MVIGYSPKIVSSRINPCEQTYFFLHLFSPKGLYIENTIVGIVIKADLLYYVGYGAIFIAAGFFAFIASIGKIDILGAFGYWIFTTGIIVLFIGFCKTKETPKRSKILLGSGFAIIAAAVVIMVVGLKMIPVYGGLAIIIICVGLGIIGIGISNKKAAG